MRARLLAFSTASALQRLAETAFSAVPSAPAGAATTSSLENVLSAASLSVAPYLIELQERYDNCIVRSKKEGGSEVRNEVMFPVFLADNRLYPQILCC